MRFSSNIGKPRREFFGAIKKWAGPVKYWVNTGPGPNKISDEKAIKRGWPFYFRYPLLTDMERSAEGLELGRFRSQNNEQYGLVL